MDTSSHEPNDRTTKLAKDLSNFVNGFNGRDQEDLVQLILRDHPTLQQSMIRLFVMVIEGMAEKEYVDGRNKASNQVCQMMISGFKKTRSEFDSKSHGRPINDSALPSQYLSYI